MGTRRRLRRTAFFWLSSLLFVHSSIAETEAKDASVPASTTPAQQQDAKNMSTEECIELHEHAQLQQQEGKLLSARDMFLACTTGGCPRVIKADCAQFYYSVIQVVPSLVITARRGNEDISTASIWIDERQVSQRTDGSEIALDPGTYTVRVQLSGNSAQSQERRLVVVQGQRQRLVSFVFEPDEPRRTPRHSLPPLSTPAKPSRPQKTHRPIPVSTYIFAGGAALGVSVGATFGIIGLNQRNHLRHRCAPYCSDSEKASLQTQLMVADIAFGAGLAAGAVAFVTYLLRSRVNASPESGHSTVELGAWPGNQPGASLKVNFR